MPFDLEHWRHSFYRNLRELVYSSLLVISAANALLMLGLLACGLHEGFKACTLLFGMTVPPQRFASAEHAAIEPGIRSIELILLAPLGYVLVGAIAIYIKALVEGEGEAWVKALHLVEGVKSLVTSLLLSILATDMVGRALKDEPLAFMPIAAECLVMGVLLAYLLLLGSRGQSGKS